MWHMPSQLPPAVFPTPKEPSSYHSPIISIPPRRLTFPDNLHDLTLLRPKYLATGSLVWILGNWLSFNRYLSNNLAFSSALKSTCFGTSSWCVIFTNRSCSWKVSITEGSTTDTSFIAANVTACWVTRMPVWKLYLAMWWANAFICLMPIKPDSVENSIQIVPTAADGFGAELVGMGVYFSSMDIVGRAEKVSFLRLSGFSAARRGEGGDYVRGLIRQKVLVFAEEGCGEGRRGGGCGFITHSGPPFEFPNFSPKPSSNILTSSSDNSYPYTALATTKHNQNQPINHLLTE